MITHTVLGPYNIFAACNPLEPMALFVNRVASHKVLDPAVPMNQSIPHFPHDRAADIPHLNWDEIGVIFLLLRALQRTFIDSHSRPLFLSPGLERSKAFFCRTEAQRAHL